MSANPATLPGVEPTEASALSFEPAARPEAEPPVVNNVPVGIEPVETQPPLQPLYFNVGLGVTNGGSAGGTLTLEKEIYINEWPGGRFTIDAAGSVQAPGGLELGSNFNWETESPSQGVQTITVGPRVGLDSSGGLTVRFGGQRSDTDRWGNPQGTSINSSAGLGTNGLGIQATVTTHGDPFDAADDDMYRVGLSPVGPSFMVRQKVGGRDSRALLEVGLNDGGVNPLGGWVPGAGGVRFIDAPGAGGMVLNDGQLVAGQTMPYGWVGFGPLSNGETKLVGGQVLTLAFIPVAVIPLIEHRDNYAPLAEGEQREVQVANMAKSRQKFYEEKIIPGTSLDAGFKDVMQRYFTRTLDDPTQSSVEVSLPPPSAAAYALSLSDLNGELGKEIMNEAAELYDVPVPDSLDWGNILPYKDQVIEGAVNWFYKTNGIDKSLVSAADQKAIEEFISRSTEQPDLRPYEEIPEDERVSQRLDRPFNLEVFTKVQPVVSPDGRSVRVYSAAAVRINERTDGGPDQWYLLHEGMLDVDPRNDVAAMVADLRAQLDQAAGLTQAGTGWYQEIFDQFKGAPDIQTGLTSIEKMYSKMRDGLDFGSMVARRVAKAELAVNPVAPPAPPPTPAPSGQADTSTATDVTPAQLLTELGKLREATLYTTEIDGVTYLATYFPTEQAVKLVPNRENETSKAKIVVYFKVDGERVTATQTTVNDVGNPVDDSLANPKVADTALANRVLSDLKGLYDSLAGDAATPAPETPQQTQGTGPGTVDELLGP